VRFVDTLLDHLHETHARLVERAWRRGKGDRRTLMWPEAAEKTKLRHVSSECNVCGWRGRGFEGNQHSESAQCLICGSISRDRFLYWCWVQRTPYNPGAFVLETSPRMDALYRSRMAERVAYTASDYDESRHKGVLKLDLQAIELPDDSVDIVLTPHVLEHVPDTDKALSELFRVLKPGGHVFLQIPLPQGKTGVPAEPEYHEDATLVFFRFGWDLADLSRRHGFEVTTLVTEELQHASRHGHSWVHEGPDCDVDDLLAAADPDAMTVIADRAESALHGFRPAYQFVTFDLRKPA
jgi:SAM-dependent methyltransferase